MPTDKPSKIGYHFDIIKEGRLDYAPNFGFPEFNKERNFQHNPHHVYFTNNEKLKEGWYFNTTIGVNERVYVKEEDITNLKAIYGETPKHLDKITLTTDPELIADGVQEIPDEFLKWFVDNPTCDFVEIQEENICARCYSNDTNECWSAKECSDGRYDKIRYKIIIPQEKPKQEIVEDSSEIDLHLVINRIIDGGKDLVKGFNVSRGHAVDYAFDIALKTGEYQAKRMYSEEDMQKAFQAGWKNNQYPLSCPTFKEWFEQFKKK